MVTFLSLGWALVATALASSGPADWYVADDGDGDLRRATFHVEDPACAYRVMAEPRLLDETLEHVEGFVVHESRGNYQDVTLIERFWPVGRSESRYHRTVDGAHHVEWKLVSGRQARHDGYWEVHAESAGATVTFQNTIEAKHWIDQPILRGIQKRTMAAIIEQVAARCSAH